MTSSWVDTNFAASFPSAPDKVQMYDIAIANDAVGTLYFPVTINGISSALIRSGYSKSGGGTSACIITHVLSGDVYNIGGISGDSTMHIVFTMWDNEGYGGRGKGK
jgi:hypothetical protein